MGRLKQQNEADFGIFALQMLKVHMSAANLAILRPKKNTVSGNAGTQKNLHPGDW